MEFCSISSVPPIKEVIECANAAQQGFHKTSKNKLGCVSPY
jgi:hypothetical protein